MSAVQLATTTFTTPSKACLEAIVENFSGKEFTLDDLLVNEDVIKFMSLAPKGKKVAKKKSTPKERATSDYECHQCDARVWEKGYGGQCSRKKIDGECMCQMHLNAVAKEGKWWLGVMTEPRPEELVHPNGKAHEWKITVDGEEVVKEKKSPKKSSKASGEKKNPGRPKGSTTKKKKECEKDKQIAALKAKIAAEEAAKEDDGAGVGLIEGTVVEEKETVVEEKETVVEEKETVVEEKETVVEEKETVVEEKETVVEESEDDEDDLETIVFEGVEYMMNPEDGSVMNPDDYSMIGIWNAEEENINFEDDGEDVHNSKK